MNEACFKSAADLLDDWRDDVLSEQPPTLYPVGTGELARIEIGPGLVALSTPRDQNVDLIGLVSRPSQSWHPARKCCESPSGDQTVSRGVR